jgi:hypothetical protein
LAGQVKLFFTPFTLTTSWHECQRIQIELGTLSASSDRLCGLVVRLPGYRSTIWLPVLPDFLSSGSGTWSTQPCEYTRAATWKKN